MQPMLKHDLINAKKKKNLHSYQMIMAELVVLIAHGPDKVVLFVVRIGLLFGYYQNTCISM